MHREFAIHTAWANKTMLYIKGVLSIILLKLGKDVSLKEIWYENYLPLIFIILDKN
jgi:hypothetical protein